LNSNKAELIAVYGRRRIGKTFLVRSVYEKHIQFEFSGIYNISLKQQLNNFHLKFSDKYFDENNKKNKKPNSWFDAFHQLSKYIDKIKTKKKKVIFIDEFPWLDTRKSKFLAAFENFWNSYAAKRDDLIVVICGSAASYMVKNIIKNKGGLHNRITEKIQLKPFSLAETKKLLKYNNIRFTNYDIIQLYMLMGGIPFYLEKIRAGESVAQAVDRLCFSKDGFLRTEFDNVFASLFEQYDNHEAVIRTLAKVRKGLTRTELLEKSKIKSGGTSTKTLLELEESGFIEKYTPYKGIKDSLYRLTDEYSMFYIKYIEGTKPAQANAWMKLQTQQSYKIWSGFSFETICIKHIEQIKIALQIAGINAVHGSWIYKSSSDGAQIDLLIDRDDNVINLCEMKFYNTEFTIDKKYANEIANKKSVFTRSTKTTKSIFVTFISSYGLNANEYSRQHVQNDLTMEALFIDL
ncbi:MAG: ATP-binding protein, partial [Saprospiraceae bacterium]|nr:ATP-binding protein [Saprospiraceae bacterium]